MTLGKGIEQLAVFVVFAVIGIVLYVVYAFGNGLCRSKLASTIFDGVFGVLATLAVVAVNISLNNGEFRLFVPLSVALGVVIGAVTFGCMLDKVTSALYNLFINTRGNFDGTDILQQKNVNNVCGGKSVADNFAVYVADNRHAKHRNKRPNNPT